MTKTRRQRNIRKLESAAVHIEKAKAIVDEIGEMYVAHSIYATMELATVSHALEVAIGFYKQYGQLAIPIIVQTLDVALDILRTAKRLE